MSDARAGKPSRVGIDGISALYHLVCSVAIDISHAQLMELCRPWCLVIAAPGVGVMPVGGGRTVPIVVPCKDIVVMGFVRGAYQAFHHQRGVDSVEIADGKVAFHSCIPEAHVFGPGVAPILVAAVGSFCVFQFVTGNFLTGKAVDDRDVERRYFCGIVSIVCYAVAINIGYCAALGILAPCLVCLVPEAGAVRTLYEHLAASVAVDVPCHYHIVLAGTDIHVRTHIDRPQQFAREAVGLQLVRRRGCVFRILLARCCTGIEAIYYYGIVFAVAVSVHWPAVFRAVVVARNYGVVEVDVQPHVGPGLRLIKKRCTFLTLHTVGTDCRNCVLAVVRQRRGLVAGHLERRGVQLGVG